MIDERPLVNTPLESPNPMKLLQNRLANLIVCTEDEREFPWIPRKFPLSEIENTKLDNFSAPSSPGLGVGELKRIPKPASLSRSSSYTHLSNITPRHSPIPSPSPLTSPPTPDSNWTVKVVNDSIDSKEATAVSPLSLANEKHRKGIVLKLAKKWTFFKPKYNIIYYHILFSVHISYLHKIFLCTICKYYHVMFFSSSAFFLLLLTCNLCEFLSMEIRI